ncbi:RNA polymerase sigma factor [Marinimicrobium sp. ABcell2]|uniref:RNA polymerase sigma factor n=1 Tax=Marinimicrobium sp. ABcell2 TaxID=3069751 RepID=UPI0027AFDC72|nr:sigma-70 family RNA polymerase sigma factor [Marinimicrobium sp. ABcell2]MDQ2077017.1 sigma-70 family RNA polymerase sigma factor [Marinimicrobium sp. ABcell2]
MSISDQALIARVVAKQDQHAFAQLVLRYQSQLRTWARRLCDGDHHLADDLAQEAFIKAYAALPAYRAEAKFSTWLYRITFNIAANRWRAKKLQWCQLDERDQQDEASNEVHDFAVKRDVEAAIRQLSAPQQLAIKLSFEDGFSHSEVAEIMGVPLGTVKTHVLRGKQKLEQLLASWSNDE